MVALVSVVDFALLDVIQHAQVVPVTVAVDAQLALAAALVDVRIHVQAAVQVAAMATAMAVLAVKDALLIVKMIALVDVQPDAQLTVVMIVVDLVDLPASRYAETVKIPATIHALVIVDQNVQTVVTTTVQDRAKEVVVVVVMVVVVAVVRVALAHAKETVQVAVVDVPVNSYFNRSCGMRCYK